ncbi:hypothetical protein HDE_01019 [Halotydeus destructor]|nr:hypothetical protein HDE_01019 [Halotydeus destructor]
MSSELEVISFWFNVSAIAVGGFSFAILFLVYFVKTEASAITWHTFKRNPKKNLRLIRDTVLCRDSAYTLVRDGFAFEGIQISRAHYKELLAAFDSLPSRTKFKDMSRFKLPGDELVGLDITEQFRPLHGEKDKPLMCVITIQEQLDEDDHMPDQFNRDNLKVVRKKLLIAGDSICLDLPDIAQQ